MAMTDPISALLTSIRNAIQARKPTVRVPASKLKSEICRVLQEEGFIRAFTLEESGIAKTLEIQLKYNARGVSVIRELKRISRPGLRIYRQKKEVPTYRNGIGIYVLSTPKGVLADRAARKQSVGGELLCAVW